MSNQVCRDCWSISQPTQNKELRGSAFITVLLLLMYIIPGIIYMVWRRGDKSIICTKCRSKNLVPVDSPMGQKIINEQKLN